MTEVEKRIYDLLCKCIELTREEVIEKLQIKTEEVQKYNEVLDYSCASGNVLIAIVKESDSGETKLKYIADIHHEKFNDNSAYHFFSVNET